MLQSAHADAPRLNWRATIGRLALPRGSSFCSVRILAQWQDQHSESSVGEQARTVFTVRAKLLKEARGGVSTQ